MVLRHAKAFRRADTIVAVHGGAGIIAMRAGIAKKGASAS
jgi:hypothetical protein